MIESRIKNSAKPLWSKHGWTKQVCRLALGGALGLVVLGSLAPGVARAQSNESSLWGSMLKTLGIGGENNIEYRERPPLVVPPSRDLPPPQTGAPARDPNWPVQANTDKPKKGTQIRDLDRIPVAPRPTAPNVAGASVPNPASPDTAAAVPQSQPAASGGLFGKLFSSGDRPATPVMGAPPRQSLTEPPPDYESPSPSQPYGAATPPAPPRADAAKAATPEAAQPGASGL